MTDADFARYQAARSSSGAGGGGGGPNMAALQHALQFGFAPGQTEDFFPAAASDPGLDVNNAFRPGEIGSAAVMPDHLMPMPGRDPFVQGQAQSQWPAYPDVQDDAEDFDPLQTPIAVLHRDSIDPDLATMGRRVVPAASAAATSSPLKSKMDLARGLVRALKAPIVVFLLVFLLNQKPVVLLILRIPVLGAGRSSVRFALAMAILTASLFVFVKIFVGV